MIISSTSEIRSDHVAVRMFIVVGRCLSSKDMLVSDFEQESKAEVHLISLSTFLQHLVEELKSNLKACTMTHDSSFHFAGRGLLPICHALEGQATITKNGGIECYVWCWGGVFELGLG